MMTSLAGNAWLRYFLTYDPAETLEQVTVNGEKDLQVPSEENLRAKAALQRGGNTRYEIRSFPDLTTSSSHKPWILKTVGW